MTPEDLWGLTVARAAELIKSRKLSPVELTRAVLERAEALNPRVNAYITLLPEQALQQASEAERSIARGAYRGPLHGIPIGLKDLFATQGIRTTAGARVLADWVPQEDCTVAAKLRQAGAVLLGKLNMHELACGVSNENPHFGDCRNPWNPDCIPGGSSGGSGAATAAGMCMASLGSDTGGSIRIPASFCGIVGLKPTYGRVSRHGVLPLSWSLDHAGPMTKTVEDAALLLNAIAGYDPNDPSSLDAPVPDYTDGLNAGIKGLRVGVIAEAQRGLAHHEVGEAVKQALTTLEGLGARVEEVKVPLYEYATLANTTILLAEAASYHQRGVDSRREEYGADVLQLLESGRLLPATVYLRAQRVRQKVREAMVGMFRSIDLLALPTVSVPPPRIGQQAVNVSGHTIDVIAACSRFTQPFNLTGLPALSVPCGFTADGLPIGLQLVGPPLGEAVVLRAGHAYEQATPWHERTPPV
ncbi:MAG: Asp-tRNA(Asn)/Glu-tRNA(Gln) amidotransferase subunit GatA [Chloroflexi bacterium]|nr:Asp-tRNA(Asn)/Glu-tRNA(Gln) amidotransferase subunit GatA [Chloroflexota bacterium]